MRTANSLFSCDEVYMNKLLDDHINEIHAIISKKYKWKSQKLLIGMFGYDNLAMSIGYIFKYCPNMLDSNLAAKYAHKGWADNYIYWRDHQPWLTSKIFKKPHKPLNDERRNKLTDTKFRDLTGEDKEINILIANYVKSLFITKDKIDMKITDFL